MTFAEAERYLVSLELFGMRLGLERMHKLTTVLGLPQHRFACIHVVGSNGKSSTARMIAAICQRHGLRTGTYTSPHLRSFTERIEIDGRPISEEQFAESVTAAASGAELVNRTLESDRVTQFELLTAAAFYQLARSGVEVAVIEAGLGGRYDATNVIQSKVQVLTDVSLEHTQWLGSTIAEIAGEKLAVVRDHGSLVVGELPDEAHKLAQATAKSRGARLITAEASSPVSLRARGTFQRRNFALATRAAEAFIGALDEDAVSEAATQIEIPGRMEVADVEPLVIFDGAHNPSGARALADSLSEIVAGRPLVGVFCVMDDKDAAAMLEVLLPLCESAIFTSCDNSRSLAPSALEELAASHGDCPTQVVADPLEALACARAAATSSGAVVCSGSIYLIGELERRTALTEATG